MKTQELIVKAQHDSFELLITWINVLQCNFKKEFAIWVFLIKKNFFSYQI